MNVNVNGVLFTAQAAGQQMERFGNGGSIILIASMSGSITNKVRSLTPFTLPHAFSVELPAALTHLLSNTVILTGNSCRTTHGHLTTHQSPQYFRWGAVWHASWVHAGFASTHLVRDISIPSASDAYLREIYITHFDLFCI